ncbi:hypothetical protein GGI35DRAFT_461677 [Trichoderma velutinum]
MKRKLPVRRPSTSTPPMRPRADHRRGRDHQEKNDSLYSRCTRLLPPSFRTVREDQKIFTLGCRGYTIINQGGFDGSFGNQSKRRIL